MFFPKEPCVFWKKISVLFSQKNMFFFDFETPHSVSYHLWGCLWNPAPTPCSELITESVSDLSSEPLEFFKTLRGTT